MGFASLMLKTCPILVIRGLVVMLLGHTLLSPQEVQAEPSNDSSLESSTPGDAASIADLSAKSIVDSIVKLESARDAKCHSTACRFEDFLYGTPLTDKSRNVKWELQKEFVASIWARASRDAAQNGRQELTTDQLQSLIDTMFTTSHSEKGILSDDGKITVSIDGQEPIAIAQVRFRQFSSIAYSLRAILSVQQDAMVGGGPALVPLTSDALAALKQALDTITVCALHVADQRAREANEANVTEVNMREAWRALVPVEAIPHVADATTRQPPSADEARQGALSVLKNTIRGKWSAYRAYNEVSEVEASLLMWRNTKRFYARYPPPDHQPAQRKYRQALIKVTTRFTVELLKEADKHAKASGHQLIRADDAQTAVELLLAPEVDDLEDVHFFSRLANSGESVLLEANDCDSYRDFGMHWMILNSALNDLPESNAIPDPFAVEIVVEAISQYGVLLLRMAGTHARQKLDEKYLLPLDLYYGRDRIRELVRRHRAAPPLPKHAGGIVSSSPPQGDTTREETYFTDVTADSGVVYTHRSSPWLGDFRRRAPSGPPTFSGGGIAADDINDDGHMDLLLVGGGGNALFLGDGAGNFREITEDAGISFRRKDGGTVEARQPILADFDNDGRTDILFTCAGDNHRIYRNVDGLHFVDMTEGAELGGSGLIGGPATVADFDGDGLLDIYICYFGNYVDGAIPTTSHDNDNALPNKLFRNEGDFLFRDISQGSGAEDTGWAQAVSHTDFDRDGRQDIVIANDFGGNAFLRNLGDGKFEDIAQDLGVTKLYHSMNVGISDLNSDGYPDVYVSNISTFVKDIKYVMPNKDTPLEFENRAMASMLWKEANMLYMSQADDDGLHAYQPSSDVERGSTSTGWAWDAEFFDFDNDGDDDLYCVNGNNDYNFFDYVFDETQLGEMAPNESAKRQHRAYLLTHSHQSNVFFVNESGKLKNRSLESGTDFSGNSRSTAYLDMDEDGDLDVVVNNFHTLATVLRNNSQETNNNWIKIRLVGDAKQNTNRDAIGAQLIVTLPGSGGRVVREIQGGSGYLSMNPKQQHIGLGKANTANIEIIWPNGSRQEASDLQCNQVHTIVQSKTKE